MKIPYQQLEQHLAKKLAPIYLVSSDELLLLQESLDAIRIAAKQAGFVERVRIPLEAEWGELLQTEMQSLSLFAEKRLLELDLRGVKLNQRNSELLQQAITLLPAGIVLLIYTQKLDQKTLQTRWYQTVEKHAVTVQIWPITREQLPQWIMHRAKKHNLLLTPEAAAWLAQQVEGNLLAAAQEIDKLALLQTGLPLHERTLEDIISDHARFDIFALVDSMLSGNAERSLHILATLFAEDTEPTLILWAITRELRMLAEISRQLKEGKTFATLCSQFRIWEKRQPLLRTFLKNHTQADYHQLLLQAAEIDRLIKGVETGNIRIALEQLVQCQVN